MARDGTPLALGAIVTLTAIAAFPRRSKGSAVRVRNYQHDPVLDQALVDQMWDEGVLGEMLSNWYSGFWYLPSEEEIASVQWAADRGYEPAVYIAGTTEEIPWPPTLGMLRRSVAWRLDPAVIQAKMLQAQTARIPNLSDELGIQQVVWSLQSDGGDIQELTMALSVVTEEHLSGQLGHDFDSRALWDFIDEHITELGQARRLLQQTEPREVIEELVGLGYVPPQSYQITGEQGA